jgi:peptidoglycan-associated lipoprotein
MIKADQAFSVEQYNKAAELYKKAYQSAKSRAIKSEIIFKQAECYRLSGNKKRAESYYKRAIKAKYPDVLVYLRYADILRMNEKYSEAKEQYQKYIQLNPTDVSGEMGLKSCDYALSWFKTYKISGGINATNQL